MRSGCETIDSLAEEEVGGVELSSRAPKAVEEDSDVHNGREGEKDKVQENAIPMFAGNLVAKKTSWAWYL